MPHGGGAHRANVSGTALEDARGLAIVRSMPKWQKRIFTALVRNSGSPAADFCLPAERTFVGRDPHRDLVAVPLAALAPGAGTFTVVILRVVTSGSCSGPRWLMAFVDRNAAEMLGAFNAGIG